MFLNATFDQFVDSVKQLLSMELFHVNATLF